MTEPEDGKPAHTPAPWVIEESFGKSIDLVYNDAHGDIATVHNPITTEPSATNMRIANARLIAAAPELLAVAERLLREEENGEITIGLIEDAQIAVVLAIDGSE